MQIQPLRHPSPNPISFGIYKITEVKHYGYKDTGFLKNQKLDIYVAKDDENGIKHKLYYLSDKVGNFIKSKLVYFENGKKVQTVRSESKWAF